MKLKFLVINMLLATMLFVGASRIDGRQDRLNDGDEPQSPSAVDDFVASKISYQGVLREGGDPVNGARDMVFEFWGNSTCTGSAPSISVTKNAVQVNNGQFSVALELPPASLTGMAYWLRVKVGDITLGCQELLPTAYALSLRPGATISAANTALTLSSSNGNALVGTTSTTTGGPTAVALVGRSTAVAGGKAGVLGEIASGSDWTTGVWGTATSPTGITSGVWGQTESTTDGARGVTGWAHGPNGSTFGVRGDSESPIGHGVAGYANSPTGFGHGVTGETKSHDDWTVGVFGNATAPTGLTIGVWGQTNSSTDFARGVTGYAAADSGETWAIFGVNNSPSGWAGVFHSEKGQGVYIATPAGTEALSVHGGTKNAVVDTSDGQRLLYSEESTEVWFADYGFGKLDAGAAYVAIDPVYAETVNLAEPYHVFIQVYGDADVYVTDRTPAGFVVQGHDGDPEVEFSYRIVARRLGFEDLRLERSAWSGDSTSLNPMDLTLEK
jgi:hypothetical protein